MIIFFICANEKNEFNLFKMAKIIQKSIFYHGYISENVSADSSGNETRFNGSNTE